MTTIASTLSDWLNSPKFQLAATAIVSGAAVAGIILGAQALEREERLIQLKQSIPPPSSASQPAEPLSSSVSNPLPHKTKEDIRNEALAARAIAGEFDEELILEQLARNRVFLGDEGLAKLRNSFIVVVGLGGVGSHCCASLARSGVAKIRLIDFDQVTLSSLNRHAVATLADVGMAKVQAMRRRLMAIAPWVDFDMCGEKFDGDSAERLLGPWRDSGVKPDYVIDAIDNIDTKVTLLKFCHSNNIPVISSAGSGCKSDPTRIMVGDISASTDDRLSRSTRRKLKLVGVGSGIPMVFSTEKTGEGKAELLPLNQEEFEKGKVDELGVLPNFRLRILPVLGTMPAIFGYTIANHVILSIAGYPTPYLPTKMREKMYDTSLAAIQAFEEKLARHVSGNAANIAVGLKVPITTADIMFLIEEVYKGRSVVTGIPTKLVLIRWEKPTEAEMLQYIGEGKDQQKSTNLKMSHVVCMTKEEATRHLKEVLMEGKPHTEVYPADVIELVTKRREETALWEKEIR
ncbi:tRNA threonylcarbamoyladenosine dehydratase [Ceratocystis fimbriata CBS 114723]|uniref:tRNA threonylcarbamoyladenosine dehydratase n=1 Tax=Ceratocystis fimbriata CBS 114723 TaxID=1035309 RepID=A0A2C5XBG9_9PEZI|nr:tRNA threonylcarbamoyladenosine dehydratase [Ceratocystis fimbriata CBS 114723]